MTKKFTEEEYQKIVEVADRLLDNTILVESSVLDDIYFQVQNSSTNEERNKFKNQNQEFILIALPESRDWAHDQFVEKEKKYYWKTKKTDEDGDHLFLIRTISGSIRLRFNNEKNKFYKLTKTEIREWGYNPDMFDKEEVE